MAFGINLKKWYEDRVNSVRDVFDANTQADYQRRAQQQQKQGQPVVRQSYQQQQQSMGNMRPMNNLGQQIFGNTARYLNTGVSAANEVADTARLLTADWTNNRDAWKASNARIKARQQQQYQPNSGLLGAGTIFNSPQEFNTLGAGELTKRIGTTTLGTAGEVIPVGKGIKLATTAGKISKPALIKVAGQGALASAGADIGQQYISTGKINPRQTAISATMGAGLSLAPPVVKIGGQKAGQKILTTPAGKPFRSQEVPPALQQKAIDTIEKRSRAQTLKKPGLVTYFDKQLDDIFAQITEATRSPAKKTYDKANEIYKKHPMGMSVQKIYDEATQSQPPKSPPKSAPVGKTLIPKESLAPNGRVKTAEVDNVFNSLPDGTVGSYGFTKKNGKMYPPRDATPEMLKNSFIDINPDGSVKEGFGITKMSFLDGVKNDAPQLTKTPTLQDALEGRSTKVKGNTQTAVLTKPVVKIKTQLAEPPMPPVKVGVQTMSPPPPPKGTGVKMLPSGKTKATKFASKTVPESEFVSEPVKGSIKAPDYSPQTEKQGYANALGRLKQQGDEAFENDVFTNLNKKPGTISRQEAIDATTTAQLLDSKGDDVSIRKATDIYEKLSEHYTAAGQTIQVAAILSKRTPEGMRGWATKQLSQAGVKPTPQLQTQIVTLSKQKKFTELADLVAKNIPSSKGDKIINLWRAGLLTAPTTTGGNLLGNTGEAIVRKGFVNPVATLADALLGQFTGKRTMTLAKPGELAKGAKQGVREFGRGVDNTKYDVQRRTNYNTKALDKYVNGVYKLMGVADKPFSTATSREALSSMAKAEAINKGLKGADKDKFIKEFIDNPPEQARLRAEQEGDFSVFKNPTTLGKAASGLKKPLGPVGDFVVPFTQVPASIATRIVQRTPIGTAHEVMKQITHIKAGGEFDQRAMSQAIGNGLFGPAIIGVGYALANTGALTYGYPTDKKERALWDEEGKQPYSVKVGDRWYSMNYLQPFGALLAIGGQASETAKKGGDITEVVGQGVATAGQSIMNQSFLKGIGGLLDAVSDPERNVRKYVEQTASSIVPNVVRSGVRASDEIQRAPEGIIEGVKSGIPGLRGQTTPKYSQITGDPLPAKDTFANQYINPLKPSKVRETDLTQELRRLQEGGAGIIPTEANKDVFGQDSGITKQQLRELNSQVAKGISAEWKKITADPRYKALSDEDKKKTLAKVNDIVSPALRAKYAAQNNFISDKWEPKLNTRQQAYLMDQMTDLLAQESQKVKTAKPKSAKSRKSSGGRRGRGLPSITISDETPKASLKVASISKPKGSRTKSRKPAIKTAKARTFKAG